MIERILAVETRRSIFDLLTENPGLHLREIQRRIGKSPALADYHLRILVEEGLLTVLEDGAYKRFYPSSQYAEPLPLTPDDMRALAMLRQEAPLRVVLQLLRREPCRHKELQELTGLPPATVSYQLKKLLKARVVVRSARAKERTYSLRDSHRIVLLITAYKPASEDFVDRFAEAWRELF